MIVTPEGLLKNILDAPVGQVVTVLEDKLNCPVSLDVIEQNSTSVTKFVRKVTITAKQLPVIRAIVKFDSGVIPEPILSELLKKKLGIGTILITNNIKASRNVISVNHDTNSKKTTREYEIVHNNSIWFTISEEIRLDYLLSSCNNNR